MTTNKFVPTAADIERHAKTLADNAAYNASIGTQKKYWIDRYGQQYYSGDWNGFVAWLEANPVLVEKYIDCYADNMDYCTDTGLTRGFTDAEEEFLEEKFGLLV